MTKDSNIIFEQYQLITEVLFSKGNIDRFKAKYNDSNLVKMEPIFQRFTKLQDRLANKDIFGYKSARDLLKELDRLEHTPSNRVLKDISRQGGVKIFENDSVLVIRPRTHAASCLYGAGTKWCTTSKNPASWEYYKNELGGIFFYALPKVAGQDKYAFLFSVFEPEEAAAHHQANGQEEDGPDYEYKEGDRFDGVTAYNSKDDVMDNPSELIESLGISTDMLYDYYDKNIEEIVIASARNSKTNFKVALAWIARYPDKQLPPDVEHDMLQNPDYFLKHTELNYLFSNKNSNWPEYEIALVKHLNGNVDDFIDKFHKKNPRHSKFYFKYIMNRKGKWKELEQFLTNQQLPHREGRIQMAFNYWMAVSKWGSDDGPAPWPEYEKAATDILKKNEKATTDILKKMKALAPASSYTRQEYSEYNDQVNIKHELNRYLNYIKTPEAKAEEVRLARSAWESNL